TATDTLPLHDALPIYRRAYRPPSASSRPRDGGYPARPALSGGDTKMRRQTSHRGGRRRKCSFLSTPQNTSVTFRLRLSRLGLERSEEHTSELQSRENL